MFGRYTDKARRAVFFAHDEAIQSRASQIEPGDLLLGVARADDHLVPQILEHDINSLRMEIKGQITQPQTSKPKIMNLPLSPETKRALSFAAEESQKLGHGYISTAHLLLGLLQEPNSITTKVFNDHGLTPEEEKERLQSLEEAPGVQEFTLFSKMSGAIRRILHR